MNFIPASIFRQVDYSNCDVLELQGLVQRA